MLSIHHDDDARENSDIYGESFALWKESGRHIRRQGGIYDDLQSQIEQEKTKNEEVFCHGCWVVLGVSIYTGKM